MKNDADETIRQGKSLVGILLAAQQALNGKEPFQHKGLTLLSFGQSRQLVQAVNVTATCHGECVQFTTSVGHTCASTCNDTWLDSHVLRQLLARVEAAVTTTAKHSLDQETGARCGCDYSARQRQLQISDHRRHSRKTRATCR